MNLIQRQIYGLKRLIASILSGGNLLQFSDSPTNAYWKTLITGDAVTNNNNYSASEDVALAPDSSMSGDRFYNSKISSNAYSFVYEDAVNIISGTSYVFSIYAKKDTTSFIQLVGRGANFGLNTWANFNIETGVLGSKGINCTSSIVDCKDGWFRCSIVALATASGIGGYSVSSCFSNTDARLPYANQFEYSVFIFGMKLEIGTAVTDYVNPKNGNYVGTSKRLAVLGFATDLHYSDLDPYVNNYPRDGVSKLQTAINYWNQRPIDAVVMNGDYTDGGFSGTSKILTEQEQIDKIIEAENVFNTATAPRKYTLGNHDMDSLNKAQNIANIASLNASYYFYDLNGVRFIHLDANYMFDNDTSDFDKRNWRNNNPVTQYVNPAQRNWLTNTLNSATTKVVVFCHQGLHSDTNNLNVTNASVVRGILESTGKVVAVFTGHEHVNLLTTINNIPYYSMKAMTSDAYPTTAYAEIRLYEKSIKVDGFGTQSSYVEKFYDLPVFSVPASYDTDAKAFLTASQVADTIQQSAINDLVLDLKSANIWTKMKAVYPIVGGTALTHKWNLKNPLDTDNAFRLQFFGGITHSLNGILPNGSTGYAKTFLTPSVTLTDRNHAMGVYVRSIGTKDSSFRATMGSQSATGFMYIEAYYQGKAITRNISTGSAFIQIVNTNAIGLLVSSNLNGSCRFTLNGGSAAVGTQDKGSNDNNQPVALGGYNRAGTYEALCKDEIAFAFVSDNLTDLETTSINTIIQSYQTKLGRQV